MCPTLRAGATSAPCQQAASQGCVDGSHRRTPASAPKEEHKAAEDDSGARTLHSAVWFARATEGNTSWQASGG